MHDKKIRGFSLTGKISSDKLIETRNRLIDDVEADMRDQGFVPVLDLQPQFTRHFNVAEGDFSFELTVYGVYVGEKKSLSVAGVMDGKEIMSARFTTPTK